MERFSEIYRTVQILFGAKIYGTAAIAACAQQLHRYFKTLLFYKAATLELIASSFSRLHKKNFHKMLAKQ